jgi:hypothetical protein
LAWITIEKLLAFFSLHTVPPTVKSMAEPAKEKLIPSDPPHLSPGLPSGLPSSHRSVAPLSPEIGNQKALAAPSTQKSLSKAQAAGIKAVEHILLKNNGGMFSGSTVPPAPPLRAPTIPPLGPASNTRSITKSSSIPSMGFAPQGLTTPTAIGSAPDTPALPHINSFDHFQLHPPSKSDTTKVAAEKTAKNIGIMADVVRGIETLVGSATRDIANLTSEVRLRPHQESQPDTPPTTWKNLYGLTLPLQSRSQSPTRGRSQSRSHSTPSPTGSRARDQSPSAKADSEVMGRLDDLEHKKMLTMKPWMPASQSWRAIIALQMTA